jgi:hypothetical protein
LGNGEEEDITETYDAVEFGVVHLKVEVEEDGELPVMGSGSDWHVAEKKIECPLKSCFGEWIHREFTDMGIVY